MDRNQLLSQVLLSQGLTTQDVLIQASRELQGQVQWDICDWLVQRNIITAQQADNARFKVNLSASAKMLSADQPIHRRPSDSQIAAAQKTLERGSSALPRVGDYEIERELSHGGMGTVYVASSLKLGKKVALKTLLAGRLASVEAIQRFQLEAQATAQLSHPNIVSVLDFGEFEQQHFLVMDLIEGLSLKETLNRFGMIEGRIAAGLIQKIAKALSYAHERGLLHRDIKPANILMRDLDNEPLLTDFGLAKDTQSAGQDLTVTGQMLGTPEYMPPEQAGGEVEFIDQRADIYSLGATLYELITGCTPHSGASPANVIAAILTKDVADPRTIERSIPRDLAVICMKCLEKEPAQRYLSASQLAEDLGRFLRGESILAKPPSLSTRVLRGMARNRGKIQVLLAVILTIAGLAAASVSYEAYEDSIEQDRKKSLQNLSQSVEEGLKQKSKQWEQRLGDALTRVETILKKKGQGTKAGLSKDDARQLNEDVEGALERYLSSKALEAYLSEGDVEARLKAQDPTQFQQLLEGRSASFPRTEWRARGLRMRGAIWAESGDLAKARLWWSKAYSLAPNSSVGIIAYLETGESLAHEYQNTRATSILQELLKRQAASEEVRERARVSLARLALAKGRFPEAEAWLEGGPSDGSSKSAKGLYEIAAKRLNGEARLRSRSLGDLHTEIPDRVVFSKLKNQQIVLQTLHWDRSKLSLRPWVSWAAPLRVQKLSFSEKGDGKLVVGLGKTKTDALAQYRIENGRAQAIGALCRLPKSLQSHEVVSVGDFDNDGRADVVMRHRRFYNGVTLLLNIEQSQAQRIIPLQARSFSRVTRFVDFDGDGQDELLAHFGEWSDFRTKIYQWKSQDASVQLIYEKILGMARHSAVRSLPTGEAEIFLPVNRDRRYDVYGVFGDHLAPQLPDAIWSLRYNKSEREFRLQSRVTWPFDRRNEQSPLLAIPSADLFPEYPESFLYLYQPQSSASIWSLSPGPGQEATRIDFVRGMAKLQFLDFDKDGDKELVALSTYKGVSTVRVLGLKSAAKKSVVSLGGSGGNDGEIQSSGRASPVDVGLFLLENGNDSEGQRLLETELRSGRVSESQTATVCFALARSYAANGDTLKARDWCLTLARFHPRSRLRALLRSLQYSYEALVTHGEYSAKIRKEALRNLDLAREVLGTEDNADPTLRASLTRYQQLFSVQPELRWDFSKPSQYPKALEIKGAQCFELRTSGLLLQGIGDGAAELGRPFRYRGGPLELTLEWTPRQIDWAHGFEFTLQSLNETEAPSFRLSLNRDGGGSDDSHNRTIFADFSGLGGQRTAFPVDHFNPDDRMSVFWRYDPLGLMAELVLRYGQLSVHRRIPIQQQVPRGDYRLSFAATMKGDRALSNLASRVELHSLRLGALPRRSTVRSDVDLSSEQLKYMRAKRAMILGEHGEAWRLFAELKSVGWPKAGDGLFDFHGALAAARSGRTNEAKTLFRKLMKADQALFEKTWRQCLPMLGEDVRGALRSLYYSREDENYATTRAQVFGQRGEKHKALLGFAGLRDKSARSEFLEAILGRECGDYERSYQTLLRLSKTSGRAGFEAALCAYKMGRYEETVKLWKRFASKGEGSDDRRFRVSLKRAKRLANRVLAPVD